MTESEEVRRQAIRDMHFGRVSLVEIAEALGVDPTGDLAAVAIPGLVFTQEDLDEWYRLVRNEVRLRADERQRLAEGLLARLEAVWERTRDMATQYGTTYGVDAVGKCIEIVRSECADEA